MARKGSKASLKGRKRDAREIDRERLAGKEGWRVLGARQITPGFLLLCLGSDYFFSPHLGLIPPSPHPINDASTLPDLPTEPCGCATWETLIGETTARRHHFCETCWLSAVTHISTLHPIPNQFLINFMTEKEVREYIQFDHLGSSSSN